MGRAGRVQGQQEPGLIVLLRGPQEEGDLCGPEGGEDGGGLVTCVGGSGGFVVGGGSEHVIKAVLGQDLGRGEVRVDGEEGRGDTIEYVS